MACPRYFMLLWATQAEKQWMNESINHQNNEWSHPTTRQDYVARPRTSVSWVPLSHLRSWNILSRTFDLFIEHVINWSSPSSSFQIVGTKGLTKTWTCMHARSSFLWQSVPRHISRRYQACPCLVVFDRGYLKHWSHSIAHSFH